MPEMESIREKLRKIALLAQNGFAGEMANAQSQLDALCEKYGVDPQSLLFDEPKPRIIKCANRQEKILVAQIAYAQGIRPVKENALHQIFFEATESDYIDVVTKMSVYLPEYRKQLDNLKKQVKEFAGIFIYKNDIFCHDRQSDDDKKLSKAEIEKLKIIASGLRNASFVPVYKQLEVSNA